MTPDSRGKHHGYHKLTPAIKAKLIETLSVGAPKAIACESVGIAKSTFYRWIGAGKALYYDNDSPYIPPSLPASSAY